jgi:hypothetical protein
MRTTASCKSTKGYGDKETRLARALEYLKNFKVNDSKSIVNEIEFKKE